MPRIIKNMDKRFNAISAAARARSQKPAKDTLAEVNKLLGENFGQVEVGQGMAFKSPAGTKPASHLATIRGKLTAVSRAEQPWAGRVFSTKLDPETNEVLVMRIEDTDTPLAKKTGGRKPGSKNKPKGEGAVEGVAGIEAARAHLNGGNKGTVPVVQTDPTTATPTTADTSKKASTGKKGTKPAPAPVKDLTPPPAG